MIERRLFIDLVLLISVFVLPWWLTLLAAILSVFLFSHYIEAIVIALMIDLLYGFGDVVAIGIKLPAFSIIVLVYVVAIPLKRRLIFYKPRMP